MHPEENVTQMQEMAESRMSARAMLERQIDILQKQARDLRTILDMLPASPTPEQDRALWMLLANHSR